MINTNKVGSYLKEDKVEELFQLYIKLKQEDRSAFISRTTRWLINKIEEDNKKLEESNK